MSIYKKNIIKFLLALAVIFSAGNFVYAADTNVLYQQYYLSKVKNNKVGYKDITQKRVIKDDKTYIITEKHSEQKIKRFGFEVKLINDFRYEETEKGLPVSYRATFQTPGEKSELLVEFKSPRDVIVKTLVNGTNSTQEIALDRAILFPYAINQLIKNNLDIDYFQYSTIDENSDFRVITVDYNKEIDETLSQDNLLKKYKKFKVNIDLLPNIGNYEWYDENGVLVKEWSSILDIENISVPKNEITQREGNPSYNNNWVIPVESKIYKPFSLNQITYKIATHGMDPRDVFVSNDRQRIIQVKDNIAYIKVKNEQVKSTDKFQYPVEINGLGKYLKSNQYINADNQEIIEIANNLTQNKTNAYQIAKNAEQWVFKNIRLKDISKDYVNASEALKAKSANSTEQALLLTSILRAVNIPAKAVVGLVYTDMPESAFIYHMWVEAYVGKWVNLDPSRPNLSFSPVHITLNEDINKLSSKNNLISDVINSFSNYEITVLNYNTMKDTIKRVSIPEKVNEQPVKEFSLLKFIKNNDSFVKNISFKQPDNNQILNIQLAEDDDSDLISSAYYNYANGNIEQARIDFKAALSQIPFNNDFAQVQFVKKLASLAFFELSDSRLDNVHDSDIWSRQISTIKNIYYPASLPSQEQEVKFASVISMLKFKQDCNSAIKLLEQNWIEDFNNSDYANYLMAQAYSLKKDYKKALKYIKSAISINNSNYTYKLEKAKILSDLGKYNSSIKELDGLLANNIADKKFVESIKLVEFDVRSKKAKNINEQNYYKAKALALKGDFSPAQTILKSILKINNRYIEAYTLLGDINYKLDQFDEALVLYKKAYSINKKDEDALQGLAAVSLVKGNYKEAFSYYTKALKQNKKSTELLLKAANNLQLLSQEGEAYWAYNKVLKSNKYNYTANYKLGIMHMNMAEYLDAEKYFKRAISENPLKAESWIAMAKIQLKRSNYFLAKTYLEAVHYTTNQNADYYYLNGLIHKNQGNPTKAKDNFKKALSINPNHREVIQELESLDYIHYKK